MPLTAFKNIPPKVLAAYAMVIAVLVVLPFVTGMTIGNAWVRTLDFVLLYIMLALGLNIVVGYAGLLDLGYIAFYAVGAYLYALLASPQFGLHWPIWVILPLGAAVAGLAGAILGAPTLRLRGDYLAIVTLGFGEIVRIFMNNLDRPVNITNGPQGINLIDPVRFGGFSFDQAIQLGDFRITAAYLYYYLFLLLAALTVLFCIRLQGSRIGRAWVAIREDEIAARAMGINTRNVKLLAFAMGASFAGVAGGLFAGFQGFISPESFVLTESIMILCMIVLGGLGHIPGVILGAVLLTITPELIRDFVNPLQKELLGRSVVDPENLRMLLFGLALILMMLFHPQGIWPKDAARKKGGAS